MSDIYEAARVAQKTSDLIKQGRIDELKSYSVLMDVERVTFHDETIKLPYIDGGYVSCVILHGTSKRMNKKECYMINLKLSHPKYGILFNQRIIWTHIFHEAVTKQICRDMWIDLSNHVFQMFWSDNNE